MRHQPLTNPLFVSRFILFVSICVCIAMAGSPAASLADNAATNSSTPATAPTAATPHRITLPNGFVRVSAGARAAICEAADQAWVQKALSQAPPGTQPSTQPSDLLAHLRERQSSLEAQMTQQLNLPDRQPAADFVEKQLVPLADHLNQLRADLVYLVITKDDLKRIVNDGWDSAQFHYNRVADKVAFNGKVDVSLNAADGDSIVPAPYLPTDSAETRIANLGANIGHTEASVSALIAREAQSAMQLALAQFISQQGTKPLKLNLSQDWFAAGVVGVLSSQYMATISGANPQDLIAAISRADARNPISTGSIDLLNPTRPQDLRPEVAPAYGDAFRRRSVQVVAAWVAQAGPDAISKVLSALRATPPTDGPALVDLVRKITGVDLTKELAPH